MMRRIFNAVLIGLCGGLVVLAILVIIITPEKKYNYVIAFPDGSQALYEAHRVRAENFCSTFYNGGNVTAVVCGQHTVVRQESAEVRPQAEAAPPDHAPVGTARQES